MHRARRSERSSPESYGAGRISRSARKRSSRSTNNRATVRRGRPNFTSISTTSSRTVSASRSPSVGNEQGHRSGVRRKHRPHRCRPGGEGARFCRPRQPGGGQHRRDSAATASAFLHARDRARPLSRDQLCLRPLGSLKTANYRAFVWAGRLSEKSRLSPECFSPSVGRFASCRSLTKNRR